MGAVCTVPSIFAAPLNRGSGFIQGDWMESRGHSSQYSSMFSRCSFVASFPNLFTLSGARMIENVCQIIFKGAPNVLMGVIMIWHKAESKKHRDFSKEELSEKMTSDKALIDKAKCSRADPGVFNKSIPISATEIGREAKRHSVSLEEQAFNFSYILFWTPLR